jgi:hypothetical protein
MGHPLALCIAISNAIAGMADPTYPASNKVEEIPASSRVNLEKLQAMAERLANDPSMGNVA